MQTIWDPLRQKNVALTPEERVRQSLISYLRDVKSYPSALMMSEVSLKYGQKPFRADLVVYDREGHPMMIAECKRPDVVIDERVVRQALVYSAVISVRYIVLSNGAATYVYGRGVDGRFAALNDLPAYETAIK